MGVVVLCGVVVVCVGDGLVVDVVCVLVGCWVVINLWVYWCVLCMIELFVMVEY